MRPHAAEGKVAPPLGSAWTRFGKLYVSCVIFVTSSTSSFFARDTHGNIQLTVEVTALHLPSSLPSRCVRWITRGEAARASRATSRESGLVSSGVCACGSSRPACTHAGWWGVVGCCVPPRFLFRGAKCTPDSRTHHEDGQRRRASPSRTPHCAYARAHAATHTGTGAGGGGSRVVSGVAGCARGGGGRRARGARASRQSWVR